MSNRKTLRQQPLVNLYFLRVLVLLAISLVGFSFSPQSLSATLTAEASRTQININDQLNVKFKLRGGNRNSEPDFSPVQEDFEILSSYRSQNSTTINGQHDAFFEWDLTLAPKRLGRLVIPSIHAAGAQSESISISVSEAPKNPALAGSELFMTVEPDQSSVYVQQQVLLKAKIYSRQNFDAQNISDFTLDTALIEAVAEDKYVTEVSGTPYVVYELTLALYPQKSGTLTFPALDYVVRLRDNRRSTFGFGAEKLKRGRSSGFELEVKPIPADNGSGPWLPASALSLSQHFSHDPGSLTAGEPITRSITLKADGLHPNQLPPTAAPDVAGFSAYADQPQTQEQRSDKGLTSERTDTIAMVPSEAGKNTLPEIEIKWFNTTTEQFEIARLPAVNTNTVMPVGSAPQPSASASDTTHSNQATGLSAAAQTGTSFRYSAITRYLMISQAVTLLLLILISLLYLRARRNRPVQAKPAVTQDHKQWRAIKKSAASGKVAQLRSDLLTWAETHFSQPIQRLEQIAQQADNPAQQQALLTQLRALDQAIYRGEENPGNDKEPFNAGQLLPLIQALRVKKRDATPEGLTPLYPSH